ncbi:MAG: LPD29 domain-containing protein [Eubacteriales bacterium]
MKYFAGINDLAALKAEYKRLALANHPDRGGDTATMQAINAEYDAAFARLKVAYNATAATPTTETAESTRSEFYTANGWKGSRYDSNISLKEIAQRVREFVKEAFPSYKFSVRTSYASMYQKLHVDMKESPAPVVKTLDELTADDVHEIIRQANRVNDWPLASWSDAEARAAIAALWEREPSMYRILTERAAAVRDEVDAYVNSYNREDCDGMIDYFDVDFYYFGCLQNWKAVKVVPRTERIAASKAPASDQTQKPAQPAANLPRVEFNSEHDGVEIYFPGKPSDDILAALKAAGYRWHGAKKCWYASRTEAHLQALRAATEAAALPA